MSTLTSSGAARKCIEQVYINDAIALRVGIDTPTKSSGTACSQRAMEMSATELPDELSLYDCGVIFFRLHRWLILDVAYVRSLTTVFLREAQRVDPTYPADAFSGLKALLEEPSPTPDMDPISHAAAGAWQGMMHLRSHSSLLELLGCHALVGDLLDPGWTRRRRPATTDTISSSDSSNSRHNAVWALTQVWEEVRQVLRDIFRAGALASLIQYRLGTKQMIHLWKRSPSFSKPSWRDEWDATWALLRGVRRG